MPGKVWEPTTSSTVESHARTVQSAGEPVTLSREKRRNFCRKSAPGGFIPPWVQTVDSEVSRTLSSAECTGSGTQTCQPAKEFPSLATHTGAALESHPSCTCWPEIELSTPAVRRRARGYARQMRAAGFAGDVFRALRSSPLGLWPEINCPMGKASRRHRLGSISSPPWSAGPLGQDAQGERAPRRPPGPHVGLRLPWTPPRGPAPPEGSR